MINVLLQTTIEASSDNWSVDRFSYLSDFLSKVQDDEGKPSFRVIARNREKLGAPDSVLSNLRRSDFDEVWLFAVDAGDGLTIEDCEGITEFRKMGRGLMVTRDHMDLGCSVCGIGGVGAAHHFHSKNMDPDKSRRAIDDRLTTYISWPNYHSGANGDFQLVKAVGKPHPVLFDPSSATGLVRYLPSHPHEGSVCAPPRDASARVILEGQSAASGANFSLAVAFEQSDDGGRAIAQSTFHHFADFNWDPAAGSPSFVTELSGDAIKRTPAALESTKRYVRNLAFWLANREVKADVWRTDAASDAGVGDCGAATKVSRRTRPAQRRQVHG